MNRSASAEKLPTVKNKRASELLNKHFLIMAIT